MDFLQRAFTPEFKGYSSTDLHCWVELENGKIMDYPVDTLKNHSMFGTDKLKYVAFDEKHQKKLYDIYDKDLNKRYSLLPHKKGFIDNTFVLNGGYCFYRAIIIHKRLQAKGLKSKVVFGSLGFIQSNGSVFYEFG
jgi:hypothetical protein